MMLMYTSQYIMPIQEKLRHCPMCNQTFNTEFSSSHYGVTHRQDACCLNPDCKSLERHRLLWLYLQENIVVPNKDLTILEIGPTRSLKNAFKKIPKIHYIGTDLVSKRADVLADINNLPFVDDFFDLIICYHVLEHLSDPIAAINELCRVIKPDGKAFFQVPLDIDREVTVSVPSSRTSEREILFGQKDHLRIFGRDFPSFLLKGGFYPQRIDYVSCFSLEDRILMGLKLGYQTGPKDSLYNTSENLYLATKISNYDA